MGLRTILTEHVKKTDGSVATHELYPMTDMGSVVLLNNQKPSGNYDKYSALPLEVGNQTVLDAFLCTRSRLKELEAFKNKQVTTSYTVNNASYIPTSSALNSAVTALENKISTTNTNLTTLTNKVNTKADSSTVTNLTNTVNSNSSSISSLITSVKSHEADLIQLRRLLPVYYMNKKLTFVDKFYNGQHTKSFPCDKSAPNVDTHIYYKFTVYTSAGKNGDPGGAVSYVSNGDGTSNDIEINNLYHIAAIAIVDRYHYEKSAIHGFDMIYHTDSDDGIENTFDGLVKWLIKWGGCQVLHNTLNSSSESYVVTWVTDDTGIGMTIESYTVD